MGVNLGKYKEKNEEAQRAAAARGTGGYNFWSPDDGTSNIRLMPPWSDGGEEFEREVWMHWNVGKGATQMTFVCPVKTPNVVGSTGECPICNHVANLRATDDPADEEIAEKIRAKPRYYTNIIDNEDPVFVQADVDNWKTRQKDKSTQCPFSVGDTKIQVFNFGPMIYEKLLKMFSELQMDLTDMVDGYDVLITKSGKDMGTKYDAMVKPPAKPVKIIGTLRLADLDNFAKLKTPEEFQSALTGQPVAGAALPPAASAPPPAAAALPPAAAAPPAVKAAPEPAIEVDDQTDGDDDDDDGVGEEEPPECFEDADTFDTTDVQCVGGKSADDGQDYDPCPFYQACGVACGKLEAPKPKAKRRRKAAKVAAPAAPQTEGDALEAEMAASLK